MFDISRKEGLSLRNVFYPCGHNVQRQADIAHLAVVLSMFLPGEDAVRHGAGIDQGFDLHAVELQMHVELAEVIFSARKQ